jgi:glycosyltransferase involved in cell wall biosynthesis
MKVALISHEGGGISSVSAGLANSLAKKKIDTTIFTGRHRYPYQTRRLNAHLEITYLPIPDFPPRTLWFQALNFSKLSSTLKDYTVIHGVSPNASLAFTFFKKRLAKPFVATLHEDHRTSQRTFVNQPTSSWTLRDLGYFFLGFPLYDFSVRRLLASSDHVTLCSYSLLEQLAAYRNVDYNRVSVIYNGIDFDEIESVEDRLADNGDDISIIYAGRLYWVKGIMFLLKAFNRTRKDIGNVSLKIFGKGPLKQTIKKFIVDSDLRDRVSYLGHVPHKRLLAEIKKSHIVVFPSLCEAQPMFMLEAMACKKPLLAFDLPFAREIITNMDNGLLAKAGDIEDLSRKIQLLVSDEKLRRRLGQAAYNHVRRKHNWDIQVEKYLKVYERVVDRK